MYDINKAILNEDKLAYDPEGNLLDVEWTEDYAREKAAAEGLTLGDDHWKAIRIVREYYRANGRPESARIVLHALEQDFASQGGRKYLYTLFPKGPVSTACRLGGLPLPPYSSDPSFGSVE
jgi:tRNA 2-thiouridine synthesizing protein E